MKIKNKSEQIILGSILGDGCISRERTNKKYIIYRYVEEHCPKQREYILWKNNFLNFNFNEDIDRCWIKKGNNRLFKPYRNLFYPNGKKIITKVILAKIGVLGLAVWFMDDGTYSYRDEKVSIGTYGFKLKGNKIIQNWLKKKFGIDSKIYKQGKNGFCITINPKNSKKFIKIIKPIVIQIPCMHYKIGLCENRRLISINKKKDYLSKNKERYKKLNRKWKIANPKKVKNNQKRWYLKNKEKYNKKRREDYANNIGGIRDKTRKKAREHYQKYKK